MESENGRVVILQSPVARRMRGAGKNWAGGLRQITRRMRWEMYNAGGEEGEAEGRREVSLSWEGISDFGNWVTLPTKFLRPVKH